MKTNIFDEIVDIPSVVKFIIKNKITGSFIFVDKKDKAIMDWLDFTILPSNKHIKNEKKQCTNTNNKQKLNK